MLKWTVFDSFSCLFFFGLIRTCLFFQCRDPERAELEDEHGFVDILEERRRSSDLGFALRTFSPQPYRDASPCSSSDLSRAVMESQFLGYVVKEVEPFNSNRGLLLVVLLY